MATPENAEDDIKLDILDISDKKGDKYLHLRIHEKSIDIGFVQCGQQVVRSMQHFAPIARDHYLIHFVEEGKGKLYKHGFCHEVESGQCFLIYPYESVYYEPDEEQPWIYSWIGIYGYRVETILRLMGFDKDHVVLPYQGKVNLLDKIHELVEQSIVHALEEPAIKYLYMDGLVKVILYDLLQNIQNNQNNLDGKDQQAQVKAAIPDDKHIDPDLADNHASAYISMVLDFIHNHYAEKINIHEIASRMSINRSYLTSVFKKCVGKPIQQYLIDYRIEKAAGMLHNLQFTIEQIARMNGFDNPLYFSRLFRTKKKVSPSEYRRQHLRI